MPKIFPIAILWMLLTAFSAGAQTMQAYQRFQYRQDKWMVYRTQHFHVYYPLGYDSLCALVVKAFPAAQAKVSKRLGASAKTTPSIIVFPSLDRVYQSNIGAFDLEEKTLPTFTVKGSRLLLPYGGSREEFITSLGIGLARASWQATFGDGLADQAISRQKIPYWFREGAVRYVGEGWPLQKEDALRASFNEKKFGSWQASIAYQPALSGQAFCYFLDHVFFQQATSSLLQQLRRKPLERSLRLVTKTAIDSLYVQCLDFYEKRFASFQDTVSAKNVALPFHGRLWRSLLDQNGSNLLYVSHRRHKRTVYLYNLSTGKEQKLFTYRLPPWYLDYAKDQYPLLSWNNGVSPAICVPQKGNIKRLSFNQQGQFNRHDDLDQADGITGMDGDCFSAFRLGQSDIIRFDAKRNKIIALTNDRADDVSPLEGPNGSVYFVSQRPLTPDKDDTVSKQGIFKIGDGRISPIVSAKEPNENWNLLSVSPNGLLATNSISGTARAILVDQGSGSMLPATGSPFQYLYKSNEIVFFEARDSIFLAKYKFDDWRNLARTDTTKSAWLKDYLADQAKREKEDSLLKAAITDQPSFLDAVFKNMQPQKNARDSNSNPKFDVSKSSPYIMQLYSAYFTAKINNDYFINRYQPFQAYQGTFKFPPVGGMAQGGFSDLFEDHHFDIGYRLPAGTDGSDFYIRYLNTKKTTDWGLTYFRKSEELKPDPSRNWLDENGRPYPNTAKAKTNYYELYLNRPIDYFSSVSGTLSLRQDKTVFLATEKYSLEFPDFKSLWALASVSAFANYQQPTLPLLYKGFAAKVLVDGFKSFTKRQQALSAVSAKLCYDLPLYRYITLSARASCAISAGDQKVLYNFGGVDNNLGPKLDTSAHFVQEAPYAFQTLVTPFRGYSQNSRFGSSYALLNLDLYFPVFQSLLPLETPLSSINNLNLGLFSDLATLSGKTGYSTPGGCRSFGWSARTTLAGYPIRFDMGWPGDFSKTPVWYVSLSAK